jgi:cytochrome c-type biogenesis protein CcmH
MLIFWSLSGAMILAALLVVMKALLFPVSKQESTDNKELSVSRNRFVELEQDINNGVISESDANLARKEMELALLKENKSDRANVPASSIAINQNMTGNRITAVILAISLPVFAISMYLTLGKPELITILPPPAKDPVAVSMPEDHPSMDKMVIKLAERLEKEPNDAEGWWTLANSYMSMKRYSDAVAAIEHLYTLTGDEPRVLLRYADAMVMADGGRFSGKTNELITRALTLEPENMTGLWLAGMAARERGEFNEAIDYWHRLLPKLENDPKSQQEVIQLIRSVVQKPEEDIKLSSAATDQSEMNVDLPSITIKVSLAPELIENTHPDDTLFVFAKAITGPPMPVAIVRKKASELPLEVTLDDSSAIMPTNKLSGYDTVNIGARISKSGNATPQSGDFKSDSITAKPGSKDTINLVISNRVP